MRSIMTPRSLATLALTLALLVVTTSVPSAQQPQRRVPTVDDLLMLESAGGAHLARRTVGGLHRHANRFQGRRVRHANLAGEHGEAGRIVQLTRGEKSAGNPAVVARRQVARVHQHRVGDKNQIFAIHPDGGEAVQLTKAETASTASRGRRTARPSRSRRPSRRQGGQGAQGAPRRLRGRAQGVRVLAHLDVRRGRGLKEPAAGTPAHEGEDFNVGVVLLVARRHADRVQRAPSTPT